MTTTIDRVLRYHHVGIPTKEPREGETYLERFGMYTSGYVTSPYGVEWLSFDPESPLPELVKTVPHVTVAVDDHSATAGDSMVTVKSEGKEATARKLLH